MKAANVISGAVFAVLLLALQPESLTLAAEQGASIDHLLTGVPNVEVQYYDIGSTEIDGIRRELIAKGPRDPDEPGKPYFGYAKWHYSWKWHAAPGGGCGTASAKVRFTATVTLPRIQNVQKLTPEARAAWDRFIGALTQHEAGHVLIAYAGRDDIVSTVRGSKCRNTNAEAAKVIERLRRNNAEFDRRTNHGISDGASFPN